MTTFNDAAAIGRNFTNSPVAHVPEEWAHDGKAAFGGLVAALGLRAIFAALRQAPPLRSVQIVHHKALAPGEVKFDAGMASRHRTVVTSEVRLVQEGVPCATVSAIFAEDQAGGPVILPDVPAPTMQPSDVMPLPYVEGVMPVFGQYFDFRWGEGDFPFTGSKKTVVGGWCRHMTETGQGPDALVALLDAWPPAVLPLLSEPMRAHSLSWTVHFHQTGTPGDAWYYVRAAAVWMEGGFAVTTATLQDIRGASIATMQQFMRVPHPG
jgi:acyl-CoA thioesterase